MDVFSQPQGWWGYHWEPPHPRSIVELIRLGSLDADLAALLWLLVEGRVPLVVAAEPPLAGKTTTLTSLLDFLPPGTRRVFVEGWAEDFAWLLEAERLGWRRPPSSAATEPADPRSTYILVSEISNHLPVYTWGERARLIVRALSLGYGMGTTLHADSLGEVLEQLRSSEIGLTDDELSHLGVVLIVRLVRPEAGGAPVRRIVAAHYLRPLARDAHGHVQRLPPAVLSTWDPARDCFDHFAWAIAPELGRRIGRRAGDFEREHVARTDFLAGLAAGGVTGIGEVRSAIAGYRHTAAEAGGGGH